MKLYLLCALFGLAFATDEYIIGGNDVTVAGKYPWQGSLRRFGSHSCGLSLISSTWGLTAAHCVDGASISSLTFAFGSNNRFDNKVVASASRVIMHENYDCDCPGSYPNDIAVINFKSSVSGSNIAAITMSPSGRDHAGNSDCWITGWGYKVYGSSLPTTLQEAHINVYTNTKCKQVWGSSSINSGHICIGDTTNNRGSCNGDSGGPLVCKVSGQYELVGATSWGVAGCRTSYPSVYSRVAFFRSWVNGKTGI